MWCDGRIVSRAYWAASRRGCPVRRPAPTGSLPRRLPCSRQPGCRWLWFSLAVPPLAGGCGLAGRGAAFFAAAPAAPLELANGAPDSAATRRPQPSWPAGRPAWLRASLRVPRSARTSACRTSAARRATHHAPDQRHSGEDAQADEDDRDRVSSCRRGRCPRPPAALSISASPETVSTTTMPRRMPEAGTRGAS